MHMRALRNPIFQIIKLQTPAFCLKTCFCKRQSCHQSSKMHKAVDFKQNAQWVVNLLKAPTLAHAGGGKNCLKPILRAFAIIFLIYCCHSTNQKECDVPPRKYWLSARTRLDAKRVPNARYLITRLCGRGAVNIKKAQYVKANIRCVALLHWRYVGLIRH